jgi:hypothetical protein
MDPYVLHMNACVWAACPSVVTECSIFVTVYSDHDDNYILSKYSNVRISGNDSNKSKLYPGRNE